VILDRIFCEVDSDALDRDDAILDREMPVKHSLIRSMNDLNDLVTHEFRPIMSYSKEFVARNISVGM